MGHHITAIVLKGPYNDLTASNYDLIGISLGFDLTMFHINHYYSACWQAKFGTKGFLDTGKRPLTFPNEMALYELVNEITENENVHWAIIFTDYFGGVGDQHAAAFIGTTNIDPKLFWINDSLKFLGVEKKNGLDEFDTVGLSQHRRSPDFLDKYIDLADELGV
ncbi:MAG: hypothetical protein K0S32_162 [Bacteroidetes bacterium]|jgi:hypothetical protein|nr:hypothetical protein [Bacteroidota bacterium]